MNRHTLLAELKLISRSPAVLPLAIGLMLCALFAAHGGSARIQERLANTEATLQAEDEAWEERLAAYEKVYAGEESMPSFGIVNYLNAHAFLPPGPLALLATGQENLHPRHAEVSLWQREDKLFNHYEIDSPMLLREGVLDFSFLVVVLMPITIIALTYNVLSSERETGRMPLLRMQPASLFQFGLQRVLLRSGLVVLFVLALLACAVLYGGVTAGLSISGVGRALVWSVLIVAYAFPWMALALVLNVRAYRSETNAIILGGVWAVLVLVVPTVTSAIADSVFPAPSRIDHMVAARQLENEVRASGEDTLSQYFEDHPDLAGDGPVVFDDFFKAYYAVHRRIEGGLAPQLAAYETARRDRWSAVSWLSLLSPPVLVQRAMESVAGTGHVRSADFRAQVQAFNREWHALLAPTALGGAMLAPEEVLNLPRFVFREPGVGQSVPLLALVCTVLGVIAAGLLLAASRCSDAA